MTYRPTLATLAIATMSLTDGSGSPMDKLGGRRATTFIVDEAAQLPTSYIPPGHGVPVRMNRAQRRRAGKK